MFITHCGLRFSFVLFVCICRCPFTCVEARGWHQCHPSSLSTLLCAMLYICAVCGWIHVQVCTPNKWRPAWILGALLYHCLPYSFETESLTEHGTRLPPVPHIAGLMNVCVPTPGWKLVPQQSNLREKRLTLAPSSRVHQDRQVAAKGVWGSWPHGSTVKKQRWGITMLHSPPPFYTAQAPGPENRVTRNVWDLPTSTDLIKIITC